MAKFIHYITCITIVSITGWKYNGFYAAVWERHLVSAEKGGPIMLYRASHYKRLSLNNFIYPKKEKLGVLTLSTANWWTLLSFQSKLFHAEKCTGFTKITWENNVSLHDISTFISAHETTCCDYQMSMSVRLTLESMYCKPPQTQMIHFIVFFCHKRANENSLLLYSTVQKWNPDIVVLTRIQLK